MLWHQYNCHQLSIQTIPDPVLCQGKLVAQYIVAGKHQSNEFGSSHFDLSKFYLELSDELAQVAL